MDRREGTDRWRVRGKSKAGQALFLEIRITIHEGKCGLACTCGGPIAPRSNISKGLGTCLLAVGGGK